MRDHVVYTSQLELARLLFADSDPLLHSIAAQPFSLQTVPAGAVRRHIPDHLLVTGEGPVVVDVKPRLALLKNDVPLRPAGSYPGRPRKK
ncbi:hypothetical protein [Streptomyces carpinensis]|uniref:Uncharacterized protein n=1 Tax=Streptomyces carpinensis TaxID=66369 RepID=A0ABV1W3R8_9ACTN|nr:hypothetical protein [Streptomyces carpinensis]